jgi:hypothetical protein
LGTFSVVPTLMHDSPNKIAKNKVTPEVQSFFTSTAVPTPGALPAGLLLLGLLFLLRRRAWVGGRRASV